MTWQQLTEIEPRLLALYNQALAIRTRQRCFDQLGAWIGQRGGMKDEMAELVGWNRKDNPKLSTSEAYDIAYDRIFYEALLGVLIDD